MAAPGDDNRQRLLDELDEMAARMRAAPGFTGPSEEERGENLEHLMNWMREHGYIIGL